MSFRVTRTTVSCDGYTINKRKDYTLNKDADSFSETFGSSAENSKSSIVCYKCGETETTLVTNQSG